MRAVARGTAPDWAAPQRARLCDALPVEVMRKAAAERRPKATIEDAIRVPSSVVGRLIGKAGVTVSRIERDYGVRIQVDKSSRLDDDTVEVRVKSANQQAREAAITDIDSIVKQSTEADSNCVGWPQNVAGAALPTHDDKMDLTDDS